MREKRRSSGREGQLRGRRWGWEEKERRNRNNKQKEEAPWGNKGKEGHLDQISQRGQSC